MQIPLVQQYPSLLHRAGYCPDISEESICRYRWALEGRGHPRVHSKRNIAENTVRHILTVAERDVYSLDLNPHNHQPGRLFLSRYANTGAPTMAVNIPIGISVSIAVREIVSTPTR